MPEVRQQPTHMCLEGLGTFWHLATVQHNTTLPAPEEGLGDRDIGLAREFDDLLLIGPDERGTQVGFQQGCQILIHAGHFPQPGEHQQRR